MELGVSGAIVSCSEGMLRWCCGSAGGGAADEQAPVSLLIPAYIWPDAAVYAQLVRFCLRPKHLHVLKRICMRVMASTTFSAAGT